MSEIDIQKLLQDANDAVPRLSFDEANKIISQSNTLIIDVREISFFGVRSLPALYLAEITGPTLVWPDQYLSYWTIASLFSLLSVVVAVESLKWSRVSTFSYSILKKINFTNYKFLIYVTILSALLNAIFTNLVLSALNNVSIDVVVISRFFIGDMIGTFCFVIFLMIMFGLLRNKRLLPIYDD